MKRKTLSLSVSILVVAVVGLVLFFRSSVVHGQTAGPPVLSNARADQCTAFVRQAMKADGLAEAQIVRICAKAETLASQTQHGVAKTSTSTKAPFLGVWQIIADYNQSTFNIYKAGDTYIVETHFDYQGVEKFPATLKDGQLRISTGLGESSIVYLAPTDRLLAFGKEYRRKGQ